MTPANWPVSAMNLDGGGSTAMAVNGTLVNHTSDQTGERPDGDFVVAIPRLRPARDTLGAMPGTVVDGAPG
jgi:hypothetical protein